MADETTILTDYTIRVNIDDIFASVVNATVLRFQAIPDSAGANQASEHAMTKADKTWFTSRLKRASDKVYEAMQAYSRHSTTYVDPDQTDARQQITSYMFNTLNTATGLYVIEYRLRVSENFDHNLMQLLLTDIEETMISYCLSEWYAVKGLSQDRVEQFDIHTQKLKDIKSRLNSRINPIKRTYRIF